jgi:DNA-binding CsgD family transcriptional regulator
MDARLQDSEKSKDVLIAELTQARGALQEQQEAARDTEALLRASQQKVHVLSRELQSAEAFSSFFSVYKNPHQPIAMIVRTAVDVLVRALSDPQKKCVRLVLFEEEWVSTHFIETQWRRAVDIMDAALPVGVIEVFYFDAVYLQVENPLSAREKKIIDALAAHLEMIIALRYALSRGRDDELKKDILANIEGLIFPLVARMRAQRSDIPYLDLLEESLRDIASSFGRKLIGPLTARETEICHMIRSGLSGKEIADLLHISFGTVEVHRNNIRKKLDLVNQNISLAAYLKKM